MTDEVVKLSDIVDPIFTIELTDGTRRTYDPFAVVEALELGQKTELSAFDQIREAFKLPVESDINNDNRVLYLSPHQCLTLMERVMSFVTELDVVKKVSGLTLKLQGSTISVPATGANS